MPRRPARQRDDLAPIHGTWSEVEGWLAGFGPAAAVLTSTAAWSPVFSGQSFDPGRGELDEMWTSGADVSWLGGPAVAPLPEWPRNAEGAPLAHVATLCLRDVAGASQEADKAGWPDRREGLPDDGVLEIFHDLQVYGWDPADRSAGGWLVRWVPEPARTAFVEPPSDLDTPSDVCQPGLFLPGFTVTAPLDAAVHGDDAFEVAETVAERLRYIWTRQQSGHDGEMPVPVTHVYGHSQNGADAVREVLADVLPITEAGDEHRLVAEFESWTHLAGWFGDAAPLEIWMRTSDLLARRFEAAWCLTRTD